MKKSKYLVLLLVVACVVSMMVPLTSSAAINSNYRVETYYMGHTPSVSYWKESDYKHHFTISHSDYRYSYTYRFVIDNGTMTLYEGNRVDIGNIAAPSYFPGVAMYVKESLTGGAFGKYVGNPGYDFGVIRMFPNGYPNGYVDLLFTGTL